MNTRSRRSTHGLKAPETEAEVQYAIATRMLDRFRHATAIPNVTCYGWESDLLTVTGSGIVHEFEIKTDRGDLLSELHAMTGDPKKMRRDDSAVKFKRGEVLRGDIAYRPGRPNHFWIVTTPDVAATEELPAFAGHLVVNYVDSRFVDVFRSAPKLHGDKIDERTRAWVERGLAQRLWKLRAGL